MSSSLILRHENNSEIAVTFADTENLDLNTLLSINGSSYQNKLKLKLGPEHFKELYLFVFSYSGKGFS